MKKRSPYAFFVLIGIWFTTSGYSQNSSSLTFPASTSDTFQESALLYAERGAAHQPELYLNPDQRESGQQLCKTGRALVVSGLAITAVSSILLATTFKLHFNPNTQPSAETRIKNSMILTGIFMGPPTAIAGTVVWIIGKHKLNKNPGE